MTYTFPRPPLLDPEALIAQVRASGIPAPSLSLSTSDDTITIGLSGDIDLTADDEQRLSDVVAGYVYQTPADEYRRLRVAAYGAEMPIGDQLEALLEGGPKLDAMRAKYAEIKARHPKQ